MLLSVLLLGLSGCSKWFDVAPKTQIKSEDFFDSEEGFKSALAGVYVRMTNNETYGRNLSFLFLENLVQRYDRAETTGPAEAIYDYKNISKNTLQDIWVGMYQNIANINNLLKNLDSHGQSTVQTPGYFELMKGEALGLRAFHYFDLLRMWGPIYSQHPDALALPYRNMFDAKKVEMKTAKQLLDLIVQDLLEAEKLLAADGLTWGPNGMEPFISFRGHRMNKMAVKGLLARVYLYQGAEQFAKAAAKAEEVIKESGLNLVSNNSYDLTMFEETLFGLNQFNMAQRQVAYFRMTAGSNGTELWIKEQNWRQTFDGNGQGVNDIRFRSGYGFIFNPNFGAMVRKYTEGMQKQYNEKIPLIRLGEMYLIAAEAKGDASYLNKLRNTRGISRNYNVSFAGNAQANAELLKSEYQKEFFAEGQFFYFLKRMAMKDFYRIPESLAEKGGMSALQYVFPLPDAEIEFGLVPQS